MIRSPFIQPLSICFRHIEIDITLGHINSRGYLEKNIKTQARLQSWKKVLNGMVLPLSVRDWHCVMCGEDFSGEKSVRCVRRGPIVGNGMMRRHYQLSLQSDGPIKY